MNDGLLSQAHSISFLQALVLGLVQGLSEFLPISSTAHLRVVPVLLGWKDPGAAFSAVIQLGSVVAVLVYFAGDIFRLGKASLGALIAKDYQSIDLKIVISILIGTVPICVLGLLLKSLLEQDHSPLRSLYVVGAAAIFMGLFLLFAEKKGQRLRNLESINLLDGLLVGLGQAMALIPGCSRSGSTLTVALLLNFKRDDAARYSFLLGIPAIVLSGLLELKHMLESGMSDGAFSALIAGLLSSFLFSYVAIWWLIKYLQTHSTFVFVIYRLIFGSLVIGLALAGIIS